MILTLVSSTIIIIIIITHLISVISIIADYLVASSQGDAPCIRIIFIGDH